ncbi:MAG: glutamine amidotransferase [Alphaproteobacteria bacterium]|jgi:GMP synthase (glutamine-hydrolysing)|nr:glutamine amidotransferase [Alphaproteobacteria bacterium]
MKTALAIRHVAFEDLGAFAPILATRGWDIRYADAGVDPIDPAKAHDPDLLCVLGGPIGAYDEDVYPFLRDELATITARLESGRPLLGICLGAQLIARAAGARVYPGSAREIGFAPIMLTEPGRRSCLAPFADDPMALHWHGDSFDLPVGAEPLASTDLCANQAFALGPAVIGFQFHPEAATGTGFERWLIGHAVELAAAGIEVPRLRAEAADLAPALADKAQRTITTWLDRLPAAT